MTARVATFASSQQMLAASLRTQSRLSTLQLQEASGSVAQNYGDLGSTSKTVLDFEVSLARAKSWSSAANEADSRISVIDSTLSSITDLLSSFRATLTSALGADTSDSTMTSLTASAQSSLDELADLLNTSFEGRYLFGGNVTTSAPVDLSAYSTSIDAVSTSYYQGDDAIAQVQVSRSQTVSYGVTASSSGFEKAFRALSSLASATDTPDSDAVTQSYELLLTALDEITGVQTQLGGGAATIERAIERQADYEDQLTKMLSSLKDVDVAAVTVQLSTYQSQLEASYAALGKFLSLSIVSYLK